jgi:epoxyqueuosine reductase
MDCTALARRIKVWGRELGFQQIGITDSELGEDERHLLAWLGAQRHGEMGYMERHGCLRTRPRELLPGTLRIISARMDYWPGTASDAQAVLDDPDCGYVSRYALGRDYHKLVRRRLQRLAERIAQEVGAFGYRAFADSAPVLEKAVARNAGLGWIGKHTNLINHGAGSWFFLGELFTDLPLPVDAPARPHCGTCRACLDVCPTRAIVAPYQLDARRCISYLTIELHGSIPQHLRSAIGNRIYGCDDCQLVCPWNRFARAAGEDDFLPRHRLDNPRLIDLFRWSEQQFLQRLEGSAIRRIGHVRWLRNIAVALGNAPPEPAVEAALRQRLDHPSELVREHVVWALERQRRRLSHSG